MIAVALATPFLAISSPSSASVAWAGVSLVAIVALLWRGSDPPILLLPVLFQWSEVAILPLSTLWKQVPLFYLSEYGADLESSAFYGFMGIMALALGLRLGMGKTRGVSFAARLQAEARAWRLSQAVRIGLGAMAFGYAVSAMLSFAGPARELFGNAAGIKYVGLFVIAYWCLVNGRNYGLLAGVVGFEVVFGMTGFFAEFKNSILTLVVAVMAARPRLKLADAVASALVAALVLFVATFWSSIKVDYRAMVNQGTGAQVVAVPLEDRLGFIVGRAGSLDGAALSEGFDKLVLRHGYIEYLALVMHHVPQAIPHEDGQLSLAVLSHITMPRILFPDKPPLPSDTEVMRKYTGITYQFDENTSISIGNLGELYIDFGYWGGIFAELVLGLLIASVYRTLRNSPSCPAMVTAGFCVMVVLPIAYFGTAYAKLMGAFVFTSVIAIVAQRFAAPRIAETYKLPQVSLAAAGRR